MKLRVEIEKQNPKTYDKGLLLDLYKTMAQCRLFDESICRMVSQGKVKGFYHAGSGQEAIGAGTCSVLRDDDYIFYMHRGCNEMIAKGVPIDRLYADFFANVYGTTKGLGAGIIHSAWPEKGVLGQPGTIGSNSTLGVGVGYAIRYRESDQVCVCYFGDGTAARELLHGALNWAGLYKLPVIFVCENNEFGLSNPYLKAHAVDQFIAEYATVYKDVDAVVVDGNDVLALRKVMEQAVARARSGGGATFIEAKTYRHKGHFVGDPGVYMDKARTEWFMNENDPLQRLKQEAIHCGAVEEAEFDAVDAAVQAENDAAIEEADRYPLPTRERLYEGLFSEGKEVLTCRK